MNFIKLNGVSSASIRGLLIQSLPPISKPLVRTQVEEIDGRDGDQVTILGYSAYDKTIEIGLHGDYDVDEVIAYFANNASGEITFSNESDKYYNYQIIQQIDFERLIRFRTAKVVFHVQPFKYSCVDKTFIENEQLTEVKSYTERKNGITVKAGDGEITITGTASVGTDFYIPIEPQNLDGYMRLRIYAEGNNTNAVMLRIIDSIPDDQDSAFGKCFELQDGVIQEFGNISGKKINYIWLYIVPNTAVAVTTNVFLSNTDDYGDYFIYNRGNIYSKPKITIYGSGIINLFIGSDGQQDAIVELEENDWITIDPVKMDAYKGDTPKNRAVTCNYDDLILKTGKNEIFISGSATKIIIEDYSRWI